MDVRPRIIAEITFLPSSDGGRQSLPIMEVDAKYRPHVVVQERSVRSAIIDGDRVIREPYLGVEFCSVSNETDDNLTNVYELALMYHPQVDYTELVEHATFTVREGGKIVAHGKVLDRRDAE